MRLGVRVEVGREVVEYVEDEGRAGVVVRDGNAHYADVVIAADGMSSRSSKIVLGHEVRARPSGDAIFRAAFPVDPSFSGQILAQIARTTERKVDQPFVHMYLG